MRRFYIILIMMLFIGCKGGDSPTSPSTTSSGDDVVLVDSAFTWDYKSYGSVAYAGKVKNVSSKTVYNVQIVIYAYSDTAKTNIIGTASGFPADLESIGPGQTANFEAIFFDIKNGGLIKANSYEITWLYR